MEIRDAFTQDAIAAAGLDMDGDEERELMLVLTQVQEVHDLSLPDALADYGSLCFVAGRVYQADHAERVLVPMSLGLIQEFMEFLVTRGG